MKTQYPNHSESTGVPLADPRSPSNFYLLGVGTSDPKERRPGPHSERFPDSYRISMSMPALVTAAAPSPAGGSATTTSVVTMRAPMEAAFWSAERVTIAGSLVTVQGVEQISYRSLSVQQRHAAAGHDALLQGRPGRGEGILDAVLLL